MNKVFFLDLPWKECCDKKFCFEFALGGRKVLRKTICLGTALDGSKVVVKVQYFFWDYPGWKEGCSKTICLGTALDGGKGVRKNSLYSAQTLPNLNPRL